MRIIKENWMNYVMMIFFIMICFCPELAFAGNDNSQIANFKNFVTQGMFKKVMDLGLLVYAGVKWFDYLNGWSPNGAFKDILIPAMVTFAAFNWITMLGWVGLTN